MVCAAMVAMFPLRLGNFQLTCFLTSTSVYAWNLQDLLDRLHNVRLLKVLPSDCGSDGKASGAACGSPVGLWAHQVSKIPSQGALSDYGGPVSVNTESPKAMVPPGCRTSQAADLVFLGPGCGLPKQ